MALRLLLVSGARPVESADAFEAEQIAQSDNPGAITASPSEKMTGKQENR